MSWICSIPSEPASLLPVQGIFCDVIINQKSHGNYFREITSLALKLSPPTGYLAETGNVNEKHDIWIDEENKLGGETSKRIFDKFGPWWALLTESHLKFTM